ncbi:FliH/SctL family protein [Xanthomonas hydrangeae]|uniref:FliH/SctL family protein n=1 Tax=Xanthomonas hydrangeae TaxID=2775159 RepID=A0AAU0BDL5_9XANT|nr:FliH/SctL family protein [Xanthomonas hydrangeae]WOB51113.1 FliH/SctL family protein [Xanthomonas hydrangeae]
MAQRELAKVTASLQAEAHAAHEATERVRMQMQHLIGGLAQAIDEQAQRSHEVAVEVAFYAVTQVIGAAYANGPLLTELCHRAVREAGHQAVALHVSEQDLSLCPNVAALPIQCDLALRPGQCMLETRAGRTEFGLDVRLSALQAALLDGLSTYPSVAR